MANPTTGAPAPPEPTGPHKQMKTTTLFRNTANPRRTTLAHLTDAEQLQRPEQPEHATTLPAATANPRRTILMEAPAQTQVTPAE